MAELRKIPLKGWKLEVNTGTEATPVYTQVKGIRSPELVIAPNEVDTTTLDSDGWGSSMTTLRNWTINIQGFEGFTGPADTPVRDPGQVALKAKGKLIGYDAEAQIRFWRENPDEGYEGTAKIDWSGTGGEVTGVTPFNVTLKGQGALADYTPPAGP